MEHFKSIFARHGIPDVVRSDNGPQFASECFRKCAREWGFSHVTSSPHFPQSNGEAERAVRTIKDILKKSSDTYRGLMAYRAVPLANRPNGEHATCHSFSKVTMCGSNTSLRGA